jgi:membrane-associated phospholipid phosphatase
MNTDSESDPLKTRCLPDSLCLKLPEGLIAWDRQTRVNWHKSMEEHPKTVDALRWLVEKPPGISLMSLVFLLLFWRLFRWPRLRLSVIFRKVVIFVIGAGLSDLLASSLKVLVGRLKPHVTFYNPNVLPALSLPSNHAFNTAFICVWFCLESGRLFEKFSGARVIFVSFLFVLVAFIDISRMVLGQHYPLDVIGGNVGGALFALIYSFLVSRVTSTKPL